MPASSSSSTDVKQPSTSSSSFDSIDDAIADIKAGKFVIVLDDENRENEGDLIISADAITTQQMAWFIKHTSGFICVSVHPSLLETLEIPMMVPHNTEKNKTAYTVTLDYRFNTTTGISAHDRALSSRKLAQAWRESQSQSGNGATIENGISNGKTDSSTNSIPDRPIQPTDFCRPGHLCPLRYTEGGVRRRRGHTEASVDLALAAGLPPVALLCELVDGQSQDGEIAARDACFTFAKQHNIKVITIEALERWRAQREGDLSFDNQSQSQAPIDQERGVHLSKQQVAGALHSNATIPNSTA